MLCLVRLLQVALHVLRQHQYRPPGDDGRGATNLHETIHDRRLSLDQDPEDLRMWLKIDTRLHGAAAEAEQQVGPEARHALGSADLSAWFAWCRASSQLGFC